MDGRVTCLSCRKQFACFAGSETNNQNMGDQCLLPRRYQSRLTRDSVPRSISMALARVLCGILVLASIASATSFAADPKPRWYPQFRVQFNETTKIFVQRTTQGTWW
jgi:hypothetical protein